MQTLKLLIFAVCVIGLSLVAIRALLAIEPHVCEPATPEFELMHFYNASFGTTVYKVLDGSSVIGRIQTEKRLIVGERYMVIVTKPE